MKPKRVGVREYLIQFGTKLYTHYMKGRALVESTVYMFKLITEPFNDKHRMTLLGRV